MSGILPEGTHTRNILQVVSICDTHSRGVPNCPPISWLPGHNVVFFLACDGTMCDGEKCCEHCAELKDSEAMKKVIEYAMDATPMSGYLRLGVQQLSELLHKKRDQRDDACLAAPSSDEP